MSTLPSSPSPVLVPPEPGPPRSLKLPEMFRLGLFQMGLGIMSVLTLGVLNRVMIGELGIPATIAAGTIALHQFVAPARVWFGQLSDTRPLFGLHRTGYVWLGAGVFSTVAFLAVQAMWRLGDAAAAGWQWNPATLLWTGVLGGLFAVYGLALSSSSTPFAALLVDVSDEGDRPRLVGIVWSMLMVGIVIGAISTGILLKEVETASAITLVQGKINGLFAIVPLVVMGLTVAATLGMERRFSRYGQRTRTALREDQINLGRAIAILTSSRQTAIFFSFLVAMTAGLFMQEAVLEPYGAEVFNMPIAATTQLNAFFGMGTLLGLSGTGFAIAPRLGKTLTTKVGCLAVAACFLLIIAAGYSGDQTLLKTCVGLFGFASGVATTGAISLMLDLTVAETAGTFIGAWGVAQALSRAVSTVLGGAILDLGKVIFKADLVAAYGLVFASQIGALLLAVYLLQRVNVRQFQRDTDTRLSTILEADLD